MISADGQDDGYTLDRYVQRVSLVGSFKCQGQTILAVLIREGFGSSTECPPRGAVIAVSRGRVMVDHGT
jgi:hypothetical protein